MRRRFMLLVCGFLLLFLPFQAAAAEAGSAIAAESSNSGVTMVAGGILHTLALQNDGTVWAWGSNNQGQLGDGTRNKQLAPVQVQGLSPVVAIDAGSYHSLVVKNDGTVWTWGANSNGQLGDGTKNDRLTPIQVQGLSSVVAVDAGLHHNLALKSDGTVWAWGPNNLGQLGDGTNDERLTPVQVQGLSSVVSISANRERSLAIKNDGTVWAWGWDDYGTLGDGYPEINRSTPVQVQNLSSVVAIDAGFYHNLALKSDGTVWAWGHNYYGQLGDETAKIRYTPVQVQGLGSVVDIAAGLSHSLAVKSDGTVWAWGSNDSGQLGDGTLGHSTPAQVQGLSSVAAISSGHWHSFAIENDGTVWAWGKNWTGQLGDGTTKERLTPIQIQMNQAEFQLSDSKTYQAGGTNYEFSLYYGYISSSGQWLSGSWSPPEGFHGVVKVSMISPEGEDYDLSLETVGEVNRLREDTSELPDGTEYSSTKVTGGYRAEWRVKGHTGDDYSPDKKVFVYVSIKYDNR